jgi:threonine synthase
MSMLAVARAVDIGAPKVIAASSGNAGASLAAYAAVAGIECVIVTTPKISPNWRRAIEMHGAKLIATGTALERWKYTSEQVKTLGWYPVTNYLSPPTGSNPFGVDGYRTIAFELAMDPKCRLTNHVIVPTARADVLWGIAKGFCDLLQAGVIAKTPKVHAVEPFPRISVALASGNYRQSFGGSTKLASIAGGTTTYQALDALKLCGGSVVEASNSEALSDQRCLAQHGLYLENSSAACLTGLRKLFAKGVISPADGVTLVGTSHGYKEYEQIDTPINFA